MKLYLSASYFSVFSEYVSILVFICLPVVVLSASLAIWLHYRQKKRKGKLEVPPDDSKNSTFSLADEASQLIVLSPLAPEDKMGLIRECRKQLRKSRAKYLALKSDFTGVVKKITATGNLLPENDSHMQNLNEKIAVYEKQIMDLQNKLAVLETVVPSQDETYYLRELLKEKDTEIEHLKAAIDKSTANVFDKSTANVLETMKTEPADENDI